MNCLIDWFGNHTRCLFMHLDLYYGKDSLVSLETALVYFPNKLIYFFWVPQTQPLLTIFFLVLILATVYWHLGINLVMQFPVFQYVMMSSLVTFFYPEDIEKIFDRIKSKIHGLSF